LLLPVPYFHVVFTLPHRLNPLIRVNQRALYNLLFQAASQTLQEFAHDPHHLGAELGITAVLHTWGQTLTEHIHVHCVVTGGGLTPDGTHWRAGRRRFLFAVQALSQVFRGKYVAGLERLRRQQRLTFAGESAPLGEAAAWALFLQHLYTKPWVVYAKPPWGSPELVLKYLSRYTHRVAIANSRLVFVGDGVVRFRAKDYGAGGMTKVRELRAEEFLRRFLLHVIPSGFVRIRHYGLLANRTRQEKLTQCRQLLAVAAAATTALLPPHPQSRHPPTRSLFPRRAVPSAGAIPSGSWPSCLPPADARHDHTPRLPCGLPAVLPVRHDLRWMACRRLPIAGSRPLPAPAPGASPRLLPCARGPP
jgi:hypothetical protein